MILLVSGLVVLGVAALAAIGLRKYRQGNAVFAVLAVVGCGLGTAPAIQVLYSGTPVSAVVRSTLPGGNWVIGIDPLSAVFLIALFVVGAAAAVYGVGYMAFDQHTPSWPCHALLASELIALALVLCAQSIVPFMGAWELMAIGSLLLILTEYHRDEARRAGFIYIVATHVGTLALFAMFAVLSRSSNDWSFSALATAAGTAGGAQKAALVLALIGFGVKAGFVPMHFWLPPAHAAAPSHVSALFSGVLIKVGIYGILRVITLVGAVPAWWGWLVLGIGVSSAFLGVLWALAQHDIKRLLAYHSIENIGIILMGIGVGALGATYGHPTVAILGYSAALLHTLNHALFKSILFFGAGTVYRLTGTRNLEELGGLARRIPLTWLAFLIGSVAIVGLPPLNGFVSEWLVFQSLFRAGVSADALRVAVLAAPGLALVGGLALACFAKVGGAVFLGKPRTSRIPATARPGLLMDAPPLVLVAICLLIGCLPVLILPSFLGAGAFVARLPLPPSDAGSLAGAIGARGISIVAAALILTAGLSWLIAQRLRMRAPVRQVETWSCGYPLITPRMQYTASSFAALLVGMFGRVSGVRKHQGASVFHSEPVDLVLDAAVVPSWAFVERAALRLRPLQQGRLRRYLLYVIGTVVALLAYLLVQTGGR